MQYLYSAAVRGIQAFIFQTNKLREIAGASNLIDRLFTRTDTQKSLFEAFCQDKNILLQDPEKIITAAAGNLTCILSEAHCRTVVREFPKFVSESVPGVEFTQVALPLLDHRLDLEVFRKKTQYLQEQRNKCYVDDDPPFMGVRKSRLTGGVATTVEAGGVWLDHSSEKKRKKADSLALFRRFTGLNDVRIDQIAFDFNDLCKREDSGHHWLAVIHADGNNVGKHIVNLLNESDDVADALSTFSNSLQKATKCAVNRACAQFVNKRSNKFYPIRPIILGGDDITLVIRGDLALDFVEKYLKAFEEATKRELGGEGLTACAGVAFTKRSFPFYYGVQLADELTKEAKRAAKKISEVHPPSAVSFYKVHSTFIESLVDMRRRSHGPASRTDPHQNGQSFYVDTYFLDELDDKPTLGRLLRHVNALTQSGGAGSERNLAISKLRRYVEIAKEDSNRAAIVLDRIKEVNKDLYANLELGRGQDDIGKPSTLYDVLEIYSIMR